MNRSRSMRVGAAIAATALAAGLAGCTAGSGDSGETTIVWWHNGTGEPLLGFWEDVAAEFEEANPGVNVEVTAYQNEELQRTLIPNQLRTGSGLDLFQQWGGGELNAQVEAGYVMDISDLAADEIEAVGPTVSGWQVEGATYGLPFSYGIEGFWYNKDLFAQAGITETPTTLDDLYAAIDALKAANITPIAVGAGDGWPAAHYWYNFALKSCSPEILQTARDELDFDDPCFVEAGDLLEEFIATDPFQEGFLATTAQQGAGSSAGLLATGQVAMELMGHWNPGVMGGILAEESGNEDATPPEFLGWFNFPAIEGADGDPTAALGGGDGFSCSAWAPPECVELLQYISSPEVQSRFGEIGAGVPVTAGSESSVADPNLQLVLEGRDSASYVQLWFDTTFGPTVGGAMNEGIVSLFGGQGSADEIVTRMKDAAATL
ncbi:MAG TPA: extracellular solute-binding protein [Rhodoglobus sp.]|nr:extracellular solute-binding protein [Rhodoglobus sp.]